MAEFRNTLYYGDNLEILRRHIKKESVDLVYLDPPFNSNATYNVLFSEQNGSRAASQIRAFEDTWRWDEAAARALEDAIELGGRVSEVLVALRRILDQSNMLAYLSMMAPRLVELHRVLKPTGSIYLHCDPTAGHYLKVLMDGIFGVGNFCNEIVWKRYSSHGNVYKNFGKIHDIILYYGKSQDVTWNQVHTPLDPDYVKSHFRHIEDGTGRRYRLQNVLNPNKNRPNLTYEWKGYTRVWKWTREKMEQMDREGKFYYSSSGYPALKQYLDENPGQKIQDVWTDIGALSHSGAERLGYPTQKPEALLERIIKASSNEDDVVLDSFCGCGTTIAAAQKLNRRWIGIDITHLAIALINGRLRDSFGTSVEYNVIGEPVSNPDAQELAQQDPYQFQWWALGLVGARPVEQKKGSDKGIDGRLYFHDEAAGGKTKQVILSVKAGHTSVAHVRDLVGVLSREDGEMGVLIIMQSATQPMKAEAASAGFYESPGWGKKYARVQILTIEELLNGAEIEMPPIHEVSTTFKKAPKQQINSLLGKQQELEM